MTRIWVRFIDVQDGKKFYWDLHSQLSAIKLNQCEYTLIIGKQNIVGKADYNIFVAIYDTNGEDNG